MKTAALVPVISSSDLHLSNPGLIVGAGDPAAWRFVELFYVNIRDPNARAAYSRAAAFLRWFEGQGTASLGDVRLACESGGLCSFSILREGFTFDGESYTKENWAVFYEPPEGMVLT